MRDVPLEKIKEYAAEDADITLQLQPILEKEIINFEVNDVLQNIELPLVKALCDIETRGVRGSMRIF